MILHKQADPALEATREDLYLTDEWKPFCVVLDKRPTCYCCKEYLHRNQQMAEGFAFARWAMLNNPLNLPMSDIWLEFWITGDRGRIDPDCEAVIVEDI